MAQITIFSDTWFEMVKQANSKIDLNLPPSSKDICFNIKITQENLDKEATNKLKDIELYFYLGSVYKGQKDDARSNVSLSYQKMISLLKMLSMDHVLNAFIDGDILVTGDMSQLMALRITPVTDEQKLLFNTILENTKI